MLIYDSNGKFIEEVGSLAVEYSTSGKMEWEDDIFIGDYYQQRDEGLYHKRSSMDEFTMLHYKFEDRFSYDIAFPRNRMPDDPSLAIVAAIRYKKSTGGTVSGTGIEVGISEDFGKTFEWMPVNYITCEEFSQMTGTDVLLSHTSPCHGCGPTARNRGDDYTRRHA